MLFIAVRIDDMVGSWKLPVFGVDFLFFFFFFPRLTIDAEERTAVWPVRARDVTVVLPGQGG